MNQYTGVAGTSLAYDANGNLINSGSTAYAYDLDNRLRSVTQGAAANTFDYDPDGRLRRTVLAGVQTELLYDGSNLAGEYDGANVLQKRYVFGPGVDEPLVVYDGSATTSKNWLYADHQGSIIAQANTTGASTATFSYGPYGEANIAGNQRFRYTGQQFIPQLNLYYYKARFYSPSLGRFLQTDPIGTRDDMNLYAYVGGNPLNRNDPTGMISTDPWKYGRGIAGGLADVGRAVATPAVGGIMALTYTSSTGNDDDFYTGGLPGTGRYYNESSTGDGTTATNPADILAPDGKAVGENVRGAKPGVQTVPPEQLTDIIDRLKGGGAKLDPNSRYPGDWYSLPNGQGGFGVRDSKDNGRSLDINIPGVPDVTKIHQR